MGYYYDDKDGLALMVEDAEFDSHSVGAEHCMPLNPPGISILLEESGPMLINTGLVND